MITNYIRIFLDWHFSLFTGITVTFFYSKIFLFILKHFKKCFTIGEAGLVSQAIIISLYSLFINIVAFLKDDDSLKSNMQISTVIIQVSISISLIIPHLLRIFQFGLFGIGIISWILYVLNMRKTSAIYILTFLVILILILFPLQILLNRNPLFWIYQLLFNNSLTVSNSILGYLNHF